MVTLIAQEKIFVFCIANVGVAQNAVIAEPVKI